MIKCLHTLLYSAFPSICIYELQQPQEQENTQLVWLSLKPNLKLHNLRKHKYMQIFHIGKNAHLLFLCQMCCYKATLTLVSINLYTIYL